jgi:hypothetical protein
MLITPQKSKKEKKKKWKRSQTQGRSRRSQPAPAGTLLHLQVAQFATGAVCACSTAVSDLTRIQFD